MLASYHTYMSPTLCIPIIYHVHVHTSPEGVTLLEIETMGEEIPPEVNQEVLGEGQVQELPECPAHAPTSYIKGKPRSILSLP